MPPCGKLTRGAAPQIKAASFTYAARQEPRGFVRGAEQAMFPRALGGGRETGIQHSPFDLSLVNMVRTANGLTARSGSNSSCGVICRNSPTRAQIPSRTNCVRRKLRPPDRGRHVIDRDEVCTGVHKCAIKAMLRQRRSSLAAEKVRISGRLTPTRAKLPPVLLLVPCDRACG